MISLTRSLRETYGIGEFTLRSSARNVGAVKACAKASFRRLSLTPDQEMELYVPVDYADIAVMRLRFSERPQVWAAEL